MNDEPKQPDIPTPAELASNIISGLRGITHNERVELRRQIVGLIELSHSQGYAAGASVRLVAMARYKLAVGYRRAGQNIKAALDSIQRVFGKE